MESLMLCIDPDSPPPYGNIRVPDGALFPGNSGIKLSDIADGTSLTIMMVETIDDLKSDWIAGSDVTLVGMPKAASYQKFCDSYFWAPLDFNGGIYDNATPAIQSLRTYLAFDFRHGYKDESTYPAGIGRKPAFGPSSGHPDIVNHLFFDGSVRNVRRDVDYALYFFWITRNNNDTYTNHPADE
jgi:hypothetical protein